MNNISHAPSLCGLSVSTPGDADKLSARFGRHAAALYPLRIHEYDIAISCAGPDREFARQLADLLRKGGLAVFFDEFEDAKILGKRLAPYLQDIYENRADFCAVIGSRHYTERVWTRHECRAALARAAVEKGDYILLVRLDDTPIEGIPSDLAFVHAAGRTVSQIANLILAKVGPAFPSLASTGDKPTLRDFLPLVANSLGGIAVMTRTGAALLDYEPLGESIAQAHRKGGSLRVLLQRPPTKDLAARIAATGRAKALVAHRWPQAQCRVTETVLPCASIMLEDTAYVAPLPDSSWPPTQSILYAADGPSAQTLASIRRRFEELWAQSLKAW